jgi:hypothetical protein
MSGHQDITLVTVRSSSETDLSELRNYLESLNCSVGPTVREPLPPDLNLDPDLTKEIVLKVLVPIITSSLPKLIEWTISLAKRKTNAPAPIIIEVKGKRITVGEDSSPEEIYAAISAAKGG